MSQRQRERQREPTKATDKQSFGDRCELNANITDGEDERTVTEAHVHGHALFSDRETMHGLRRCVTVTLLKEIGMEWART